MPTTYEPIATTTLGSAAATISFTSITSAYTDVRVVLTGTHETTSATIRMTVNSSATGYSYTHLLGNGTSAISSRGISSTRINTAFNFSSTPTLAIIDWFSYAGSTNKTCLIDNAADLNGSGTVYRTVGLWQNTSAITSIELFPSTGNFATGTTATLYGILKA